MQVRSKMMLKIYRRATQETIVRAADQLLAQFEVSRLVLSVRPDCE